ncbi:MAG: hypothetical protein IT198_16010 [Acidimicrobiia bacterium]|nr:hypothetical protein [Acidimicrobiia bacterium]
MPAGLVRDLFSDAARAGPVRTKASKLRTFLLLGVGALIGGILFALANFLVVPRLLRGDPAEPVGLDDALEEFRGGGADSGGSAAAPETDPTLTGDAVGVPGQDPSSLESSTDVAGPESGTENQSAAPGAAAVLRPPQGVYSFSGKGSESTKPGGLPAETSAIGPTVAAVVRHAGADCWTLELKLHTKHSLVNTYCAGEGSLTTPGSESEMVTFGKGFRNSVRCNPAVALITPGMAPGAAWKGACALATSGGTTGNSTLDETWTYVATETVLGTPTWHLRSITQSSGSATGSTEQNLWISQANGLPLKIRTQIRAVSSAPVIGSAVHTEEMELTVESLTPRT